MVTTRVNIQSFEVSLIIAMMQSFLCRMQVCLSPSAPLVSLLAVL